MGADCTSGPIVTVVSATEDSLTETDASLANDRRRVNGRPVGLQPGIPGAVRREVESAQLLANTQLCRVGGKGRMPGKSTRKPDARVLRIRVQLLIIALTRSLGTGLASP